MNRITTARKRSLLVYINPSHGFWQKRVIWIVSVGREREEEKEKLFLGRFSDTIDFCQKHNNYDVLRELVYLCPLRQFFMCTNFGSSTNVCCVRISGSPLFNQECIEKDFRAFEFYYFLSCLLWTTMFGSYSRNITILRKTTSLSQ